MSAPVPIERQIAAARDEVSKRKRLYPKWVRDQRMTQDEADDRIACMQAVQATLERVRDEERAKVAPGLF